MNFQHQLRIKRLSRTLESLAAHVIREIHPLTNILIQHPAKPSFSPPSDEGLWQPIQLGQAWGEKQQWTAFRATTKIPGHWKTNPIELHLEHQPVYLDSPWHDNFPAGPEGLLFIDNTPVGAIDQQHHRIRHPFAPSKSCDIRAIFFDARCRCRHILQSFALHLIDEDTETLYHQFRVALDRVHALPPQSPGREKLIRALEAATHQLDLREYINAPVPENLRRDPDRSLFYNSIPAAQQAFDEAAAQIADYPDAPEIICLGHAHIDLAWLWPISQTHHKCVRTFATQCRLLEQFPDWVFIQSSPQAYAWLQADAPELFDRVKKLIDANRWEAEGATWVEMDTNVPSGESLVRQLLYGKQYFSEQLEVDSRVLWLPDVFGYSAALPQLLKLADVTGFVTSKISWSQYNRFPHDTFQWRGLDGSTIPTHFITTPLPSQPYLTYNAMLTVDELLRNWDEYRQKDQFITPLLTFGYGDGGGGPTESMLHTASILNNAPAIPPLPRAKFQSASSLMQHIANQADSLPTWSGELYLEYHRGTYTTQAWIKRANRKNEIRLHNLEWLSALAHPLNSYKLDKAQLDSLWQNLLLLQFHDILPGSSVGEVYSEARPIHKHIADSADALIDNLADHLIENIDTTKTSRPVVLFNTLSWDRTHPVQLPHGSWRDDLVIPATGWTVVDPDSPLVETEPTILAASPDARTLSNRFWAITLNEQGQISQLLDRATNRSVLPTNAVANQWLVFQDRPIDYDAWDIDDDYRDFPLPAPALQSITLADQNSVRLVVQLTWQMPSILDRPGSTITQQLILYARHPRIDFHTVIDWHEHHQLLKVAFPLDVHADSAAHQIQFGHIHRPTHRNTSWDVARFETCAHQFVDLSEHDYGVALLNDCKYGYDVLDNTIRLTCIKSPQAPDATADQGRHEFTYSLLPHAGSLQQANVIRAAAELNTPLIIRETSPSQGPLPPSSAFIQSDHPAVIVDTLKVSEDGKSVIARLYESHGSHASATLTLAQPLRSASVTNLLEQPLEDSSVLPAPSLDNARDSNKITLAFSPFQIITLRLNFK